jgi:hypothetical protein
MHPITTMALADDMEKSQPSKRRQVQLEGADLDEPMEVASNHPVARLAALELRPFVEE